MLEAVVGPQAKRGSAQRQREGPGATNLALVRSGRLVRSRTLLIGDIARRLRCPIHGGELSWPAEFGMDSVLPVDGWLFCGKNCRFEIRQGIPRFVGHDGYATAFGRQWQRYRRTQLDSYTGCSYSRQRLERCLGNPLDTLRGKTVLECGSGAGRFTELLLQ